MNEFFAEIEQPLRDFSERFNLRLKQFPKDRPVFDFRFRHPSGGIGGILVLWFGESIVRVSSVWHIDDVDKLQRKVWFGEGQILEKSDPALTKALEAQLRALVAMSPDVLRPAKYRYDNWIGREGVIALRPLGFPVPNLSSLESSDREC